MRLLTHSWNLFVWCANLDGRGQVGGSEVHHELWPASTMEIRIKNDLGYKSLPQRNASLWRSVLLKVAYLSFHSSRGEKLKPWKIKRVASYRIHGASYRFSNCAFSLPVLLCWWRTVSRYGSSIWAGTCNINRGRGCLVRQKQWRRRDHDLSPINSAADFEGGVVKWSKKTATLFDNPYYKRKRLNDVRI